MLNLGSTLPNIAEICLQKSTTAKFHPFTDRDKDLLEKILEDMVGGPSIAFTRKAVVDETFIRDSTNLCKSIVEFDASQFYLFSMCQAISTGLFKRWELDSESGKFKGRQNKTRKFVNIVMSYCQRVTPQCKAESFYTRETLTKKMLYMLSMAFVETATLRLKLGDAIISVAHFKKLVLPPVRKKLKETLKRKNYTNYGNSTLKNKVIESMRCTNVIRGTCTGQIKMLNSICANCSPTGVSQRKKTFGQYQIWKFLWLGSI